MSILASIASLFGGKGDKGIGPPPQVPTVHEAVPDLERLDHRAEELGRHQQANMRKAQDAEQRLENWREGKGPRFNLNREALDADGPLPAFLVTPGVDVRALADEAARCRAEAKAAEVLIGQAKGQREAMISRAMPSAHAGFRDWQRKAAVLQARLLAEAAKLHLLEVLACEAVVDAGWPPPGGFTSPLLGLGNDTPLDRFIGELVAAGLLTGSKGWLAGTK